MAVQMMPQLMKVVGALRYEPISKRIRGLVGGEVVVDSTGALLVWEPRRVVPSYAVPAGDVLGELVPAVANDVSGTPPVRLAPGWPSVYDPRTAFALHTAEGEALTLRSGDGEREGAAFRPDDPDLSRYVVLDFDAFDTWLEEDEEVVSHPRDPFHRVDVRRSSRHVRIERDGQLLGESKRPNLLFETALPVRSYLPRRTCGSISWNRAPPGRRARTRARQATCRSHRRRPTSRGPTSGRSRTRCSSPGSSRSSTSTWT